MEADNASLLLEADDAVDLGLGHDTDLEFAHAALGALEA